MKKLGILCGSKMMSFKEWSTEDEGNVLHAEPSRQEVHSGKGRRKMDDR
jgi:hypothetical protein